MQNLFIGHKAEIKNLLKRQVSPATKSLPHAVEPIGTDTMQNQQIIVVVLGSTL